MFQIIYDKKITVFRILFILCIYFYVVWQIQHDCIPRHQRCDPEMFSQECITIIYIFWYDLFCDINNAENRIQKKAPGTIYFISIKSCVYPKRFHIYFLWQYHCVDLASGLIQKCRPIRNNKPEKGTFRCLQTFKKKYNELTHGMQYKVPLTVLAVLLRYSFKFPPY